VTVVVDTAGSFGHGIDRSGEPDLGRDIVARCGDMQTLPGLGVTPAAVNVDIDDEGRTVGLI
jgi:Formate--tetrahydrofolate ligase